MTIGRRRGAAAALLVVAVVGLSGCSDDPEPTFAPPSSSPTATESASGPAKEPWEKKTDAGAVAFAKHWIDVFNEAQQTGATDSMRTISAPQCESCSRFAGQLEELYASGGRLDSDGWRVLQASTIDGLAADRPRVALKVKQSPQRIHQTGEDPAHYPGGLATFTAQLAWDQARWKLTELVLVR